MQAERGVPHDDDAEVRALAAMLEDPECIGSAVELLEQGDFYRRAHREVFAAMLRLSDRGEVIDDVSLADELRRAGVFEEIGGYRALSPLLGAVVSSASLKTHAGIVKEKAERRALLEAAGKIEQAARSERDVKEAQDEAERLILAATEVRARASASLLKGFILPALERAESQVRGLETGFYDVDEMTLGFEPGELVTIAGATSMGKTAFANRVAVHITSKQTPVQYFSLEMSKMELTWRMLCTEGMVDGLRYRRGGIKGYPDAAPRLEQAARLLNTIPLWVDDSGGLSLREVRARAIRARKEHRVGAVFLDNLQNMRLSSASIREGIVEATSGLKALARELDIVVFMLSHLSRIGDRAEKKPQLSDLKESSSIEQDSDAVLFIHRPEYYFGATDKEGNNLEGRASCIIAKRRNGATGEVPLHFYKQYARFDNASSRSLEAVA